jgi:hypothetical protein
MGKTTDNKAVTNDLITDVKIYRHLCGALEMAIARKLISWEVLTLVLDEMQKRPYDKRAVMSLAFKTNGGYVYNNDTGVAND